MCFFPASDKGDKHKGAKDKSNTETKAEAKKGFEHFLKSFFVETHAGTILLADIAL